MGMEDYAIRLQPFLRQVTVGAITVTLLEMGFTQLLLSRFLDGAELSHPPRYETYWVMQSNAYVIEAKLKVNEISESFLSYLDVRFAVCQPRAATERLIQLVCHLALHYEMAIDDGNQKYTHSAIETSFPPNARERILEKQTQWRNLFSGDNEELAISTRGAWKHFMDKHHFSASSNRP